MNQRLRGLADVAVAAILCQGLLTSALVVGFVQRLMQRETLRSWHRASGRPDREFSAFASGSIQTRAQETRPTWLRGLFENARLGFGAALNSFVLTLPGCGLWLFAWYDGWNNSFTKGYEQAQVGPLLGILGTLLFIAAMLILPLAQARQAATGRWRSFYDFPMVWRLARQRWASCAGLAALYAAWFLPVMFLKTLPMIFDRSQAYAELSDARVLEILRTYYFFAGAFVFVAYRALRRAAARLYAGALLDALRDGSLPLSALASIERDALGRLDLLQPAAANRPDSTVRAVRGAGLWLGHALGTAAAAAIWLAFAAQIFVSEFLNYHPVQGWLNQPLVQLPFFQYLPPGL